MMNYDLVLLLQTSKKYQFFNPTIAAEYCTIKKKEKITIIIIERVFRLLLILQKQITVKS